MMTTRPYRRPVTSKLSPMPVPREEISAHLIIFQDLIQPAALGLGSDKRGRCIAFTDAISIWAGEFYVFQYPIDSQVVRAVIK
jgi:hypothetical protein